MKYISYPFLVVIIALIPFSVGADTLMLKDGTTITGEIKSAGLKKIVISTIIGELTLDREKILKFNNIDYDSHRTASNAEPLSIQEREQLAEAISAATILEFLEKNPEGFGLGLTIGHGVGLYVAYDYNFSGNSQLHVQFDTKSNHLFGTNRAIDYSTFVSTDIYTQKILTTYRFFPIETRGFYIGTGAGISYSAFTLDGISSIDRSDPDKSVTTDYVYAYRSHHRGAFIVGEFGLQSRGVSGYNRYYAHIGFQLAKYIYENDSFDINQLQTSPYNHLIIDLHEEQKYISQLFAGLGYYF